jgi:hypothetical protein
MRFFNTKSAIGRKTGATFADRALGKTFLGTTMADRSGLKFVGFIFATVTLAVMLATGMVVKGYAEGSYSFESASSASRSVMGR